MTRHVGPRHKRRAVTRWCAVAVALAVTEAFGVGFVVGLSVAK